MTRLITVALGLLFGGCSLLGTHTIEKDWKCKCDCESSKFECYKDGGTTIKGTLDD